MAGSPAAFLGCNLFEWWIHKYVMHRPVPGLWASTSGIPWRTTSSSPSTSPRWTPAATSGSSFPALCAGDLHRLSLVPAWHPGLAGSANAGWLLLCTTPALPELRVLSLGLPREGRPPGPAPPLREHDPPPSCRPPQPGDHDGAELQPHLPDRRLALRHLRPVRAARHVFNGYDTSHVRATSSIPEAVPVAAE